MHATTYIKNIDGPKNKNWKSKKKLVGALGKKHPFQYYNT